MFKYFGREVFSKGIKSYFVEFSFKNTTLDDFIGHMDKAAKELGCKNSLIQWTDSWLKTAGCNIIWHEYECDTEGRIKKFTVH